MCISQIMVTTPAEFGIWGSGFAEKPVLREPEDCRSTIRTGVPSGPVFPMRRVLTHEPGVDLETEAGAIGKLKGRVPDYRRLSCRHLLVYASGTAQTVFGAVEICRRGGELNRGISPHQCPHVVQGHGRAVQSRVIGD